VDAGVGTSTKKEISGDELTKEVQNQLFGGGFFDEPAETDPWQDSQKRMSERTKKDWTRIQAEVQESNTAFAAAMDAGLSATSGQAMDAAEQHRLHVQRWFYDITTGLHRDLGDRYVTDVRFKANYENVRAGMAQYVRDAIHANADRAATVVGQQS
jgi:hypothetical protein